MSHTVTISDRLYERLESETKQRGFTSIEQLLVELWNSSLRQRQETVQQIDALRERLTARYGTMADSTGVIRDDRAR